MPNPGFRKLKVRRGRFLIPDDRAAMMILCVIVQDIESYLAVRDIKKQRV
jgi:hypothetical protein